VADAGAALLLLVSDPEFGVARVPVTAGAGGAITELGDIVAGPAALTVNAPWVADGDDATVVQVTPVGFGFDFGLFDVVSAADPAEFTGLTAGDYEVRVMGGDTSFATTVVVVG